MLIGFFIITAIILIKYKPIYKVSMSGQKLGYSNSKEDIYTYIDEILDNDAENVAFVILEEEPEFNLQLANRNIKPTNEAIKEEIESEVEIQYTSYAITYNKKNIAYVSNNEKAEEIIEELKKKYNKKYTNNLGILQVYSENYEEIEAIDEKEAKTKVASTIKEQKRKDTTVRVAKTNTNKTASVQKESSANGVVFSVRPVSGTITSRFGYRNSPGGVGSTNHKGIDIATSMGTSIMACASGTVKFAGYKGSYGNLVIISHGNGVETYYAHCSKLYVSSGQSVNAGDVIAAVGKTGSATGPHLHLEVHINGSIVNPQKYLY